MKVAIVDDDPIVCSSIGTILTTTGTAEVVWTAHDGAAAVVAYARQKPDVLLIDVQMPGTDGLEASERILVLTTFADPEYIRRAIERLSHQTGRGFGDSSSAGGHGRAGGVGRGRAAQPADARCVRECGGTKGVPITG